MNYLTLHLFVTVYLCSKRTFGHSSKKTNKFDVDDFISSLLSSRKFDELADKIADKAVLKLASVPAFKGEHAIENNDKNSDADSTEHATQRSNKKPSKYSGFNERAKGSISNNENDEKQTTEEAYKPRLNKIELRIEQGEADYKEKAKKSAPKDENKDIQEEVVIEEVQSPVQKYTDQDDAGYEETKRHASNDNNKMKGKINTEALLKNDDDSDQPKLLLKYEHFKKRVQQNKEHDVPQVADEVNNYFKNFKISIHENDKSNENKDQTARHSPKIDSTEKKPKLDKRIKLRGRKDKEDSRDGEPDTMPEYNVRKPLFRDGSKYKIGYETPPHFIIRTTKQYYEYEDNEKTGLRNGPVLKHNFTDSRSYEAGTDPTPGYEGDEGTTRKRIIRKEGGRYYTYLSGPDYEEFQEELQRHDHTNEPEKVAFN